MAKVWLLHAFSSANSGQEHARRCIPVLAHTLFPSPSVSTQTHTVTLWALLGSLNEKEKSFIRLIFAAPRSTF